jgi:hypothetical protein
MKTIIITLSILIIIAIWIFPIVLSALVGNWWLILLYAVWWMPAGFLTGVILILTKYEK